MWSTKPQVNPFLDSLVEVAERAASDRIEIPTPP